MSSMRCFRVIFYELSRNNSRISSSGRLLSIRYDLNPLCIYQTGDTFFTFKRPFSCSQLLFKKAQDGVKSSSDTIELLGINGEPRGIMKIQKAELLAKQEKLKLQQVGENSDHIPVYCFVAKQSKEKVDKKADKSKSSKSLKLSSGITSHDLGIKVKQIAEWIGKGHEVKISIKTGNSVEGENKIFDSVTSSCKEIATIQNSKKTETELVFQLTPKPLSANPSLANLSPLKLEELKSQSTGDLTPANSTKK